MEAMSPRGEVKDAADTDRPGPRSRHAKPSLGHVRIENVSIGFGDEHTGTVVKSITADIPPGQFVCILGPSGCGKSSLLNAVAGLIPASEGLISVDGVPVCGPSADRGMVFQQHSLFPWKTVLENVAFGPRMAGKGGASESIARTFLGLVGLLAFANRYPSTLSGGMQQRVGIARALANYPRVLLMDEPFGALDAQTRLLMQEGLLKIWSEFSTTVLFVTHDVDEAVFLADRILVMGAAPGRWVADIAVDMTRPRPGDVVTCPEFLRCKKECLTCIRDEVRASFNDS
ncbi:MAG: ABC transporter ATP-binding protein [Acidiferrobacter sp.]